MDVGGLLMIHNSVKRQHRTSSDARGVPSSLRADQKVNKRPPLELGLALEAECKSGLVGKTTYRHLY